MGTLANLGQSQSPLSINPDTLLRMPGKLPHMGFEKLVAKLRARNVRDPKALAATIGRKKYGKETFQKMAAAGRRNK